MPDQLKENDSLFKYFVSKLQSLKALRRANVSPLHPFFEFFLRKSSILSLEAEQIIIQLTKGIIRICF